METFLAMQMFNIFIYKHFLILKGFKEGISISYWLWDRAIKLKNNQSKYSTDYYYYRLKKELLGSGLWSIFADGLQRGYKYVRLFEYSQFFFLFPNMSAANISYWSSPWEEDFES